MKTKEFIILTSESYNKKILGIFYYSVDLEWINEIMNLLFMC